MIHGPHNIKYEELVLKLLPNKQEYSLQATFLEIDKAWKIPPGPEQRKLFDDGLAHTQLSEQPTTYIYTQHYAYLNYIDRRRFF